MLQQIKGKDWLFLFACLGLGILAETSFLHGRIGVSYLIFIAGFYLVLFLRFRLSFNHRRIGLLFMVAIWILSGSYLVYANELFYILNVIIIPILVFSHIVLITSPNTFQWDTPKFILRLVHKLQAGKRYSTSFINQAFKGLFKHMNDQTAQILKRVLIGLAIGIPMLFVITGLLMSADAIFQDVMLRLPAFILQLNFLEGFLRTAFIVVVGFLFFGVFQVLFTQEESAVGPQEQSKKIVRWDSITAITILILINAIYLLFVVIQFRYFFSGMLMEGFTYAAYARRGFAELVVVLLINWTLLMSFLKLVQDDRRGIKLTMNILYSLLIVVSGVMLASAYQRLSMYEAAYGFTLDRLLAHAFMIFLMIIFAYTFIRVWIERLSVTHFYLIMGLTFYTVLNVVNVDQIIVDQNIERYEKTGKIDIYYLHSLSYTGWDGLIHLYELGEDDPALTELLIMKQEEVSKEAESSWQSFNFAKQKVAEKLNRLVIKEDVK